MSAIHIRPATMDDAAIIAVHRRRMFSDMGYSDQAALDAMDAAFRPWVVRKMQEGEYLEWLACTEEGEVVAGAGLWLMDWPPHMIGPGARRANILNVYTHPHYRRQGLARRLIQTALDWCKANGIAFVILHASKEGRALYESLGFTANNEMRLLL